MIFKALLGLLMLPVIVVGWFCGLVAAAFMGGVLAFGEWWDSV